MNNSQLHSTFVIAIVIIIITQVVCINLNFTRTFQTTRLIHIFKLFSSTKVDMEHASWQTEHILQNYTWTDCLNYQVILQVYMCLVDLQHISVLIKLPAVRDLASGQAVIGSTRSTDILLPLQLFHDRINIVVTVWHAIRSFNRCSFYIAISIYFLLS